MSKKSLLIIVVLFFMLVATAMAFENKNANENFTNQNEFGSKPVPSETSESFKSEYGISSHPVGLNPLSDLFKIYK